MNQRFLRSTALAALIALAACSAPPGGGTTQSVVPAATSRHIMELGGPPTMDMNVNMYDAPLPQHGDTHVYLAVAGMGAVAGGTVLPLTTYGTPRTIDLLTLKHTPFPISGSLPAGSYDAIRLLVDTANSNVVVDGRVYPMVFTKNRRKGSQPQIIALDAAVSVNGSAGDAISVDVDFNVLESISLRNGVAYARPKLVVARTAARVKGRIVNAAGAPVENATIVATDKNGDVVNTTLSEDDGTFTLHALRAGTYHLSVRNTYLTDAGDVVVAEGATQLVGPQADVVLAPADVLDLGSLSD